MDFETTPLLAETGGIEVSEKELKCNYNKSLETSSSSTMSPSAQLTTAPQIKELPQHDQPADENASAKMSNPNITASSPKKPMSAAERSATKKSLFILAGIFVTSLAAMFYVYMIFPELNESEKQHMKIPRDIQDAKMLAKVLDRYKDMYYFEVMFGVVVAYIFLQTFAIPGSLFLSILLGFLYRFPIALFLICFCSSLGATLCYSLSNLVGRRLIRHFWPKKISEWSKHVDKHRDSLFNYMLFLRMTPILPNWFINLASPVIGVPLFTFAFGTFCGVAPPSVLAIQAGKTLQKMTSSSDAFSWTSMGILSLCACLSLVPGLLKNKLKKKVE
ncbi:transmembrane protein 41 homolog isoform X1 [Musca domestica]|uniref:Transmembrane protein 41 homolog isoform X1 n=1 Tax=Musca domestica TaxID=7370 RepID=A0ABM3UWX4_MUSDO|nr:transmembrane protein 41 homolog isoform X1 [Musca domestica]XP_058978028.1 transmembrane protein 41 homolog isoform X1 [Musca domestica]XP_058978030.1 transmembrane protein 41 homolog isoform X1 [Musca domestica]